MKNALAIFAVVLLSLAIISGCEKNTASSEANWQFSIAKIIGLDSRSCPCCGGFFTEIDGELYRILEFTEDLDSRANIVDFPYEALIRWQPVADPCLGDEIRVAEFYILE
jgi:hypothetical protein